MASDDQVRRLVDSGIVAVPQGRFVSDIGDGVITALGPGRANRCYRMRSWLDAGAVLPDSSDAPVAHGSPLLGIHDMSTGAPRRGMLADFALLSDDLLSVDPGRIDRLTVGERR